MKIINSIIKAILFDMDGVLVDAREWHYAALNNALEPFGCEIDLKEHLEEFDGLPTRVKLGMLTKKNRLPAYLHDLISEQKQRYTMELVWKNCHPLFSHEILFRELKKSGIKTAVCSNSIGNTVKTIMKLVALEDFLDLSLSTDDVTEPKPSPEIYEMAMRKLNVEPLECLVIEDNPNGIQAAIASGANVMKVSDPYGVSIDTINEFIKVNKLTK